MTIDATRREFLKTSAVTAGAAFVRPDELVRPQRLKRSVIQILLTGGPSQIDTWDPKPQASEEIRGPLKPIATAIPGIQVTELFPRIAQLTDKLAFLRTLHHDEAPIHETGQQLVQTGGVFRDEACFPHFGAVASQVFRNMETSRPTWIGLPGPLGNTGVPIPHGQEAGLLGEMYQPQWMTPFEVAGPAKESSRLSRLYGKSVFGRACLAARRLVERGVRVVTINMFDTVFDHLTWDMHAYGGGLPTTIADYRRHVCPLFDQVFSALVIDLSERGMLEDVFVVATGELGRTPKLNRRGGRDHWTGCWTGLAAGGGIKGGQVLGETDDEGAYPKSRPIAPAELVATIYHSLGFGLQGSVSGDILGNHMADVMPLSELFS